MTKRKGGTKGNPGFVGEELRFLAATSSLLYGAGFKVPDIAGELGVSEPTVRKYLAGLADAGKLVYPRPAPGSIRRAKRGNTKP